MAYWITSGHLVEAILVLTVIEFLALTIYHRQTGRGLSPSRLGWTLLSGVCLLIALREALVGSGWIWIAAALTGALGAHVTDLARRWNR